MPASAPDVLDALVAALQAIDGTGAYTYTLAAGQVQVGRFKAPPAAVPFIAVEVVEVTDDDATTRSADSTGTFTVVGWAPSAPKIGAAKVGAALALGADIRRAARASTGLRALIHRLHVTFAPLPDDTQNQTGAYARVVAVVAATWREPLP